MKKITICFFTVALFFACKKKETTPTTPTTVEAKTMLDVPYGVDANQKMDIYLPKNRSANTNTIVLVHGGAWFSGDKFEMKPFVDTLRNRLPNYAFVNINYRLAFNPINLYPAANNDLNAAINFLLSKKEEYILSNKLGLIGVSAGGHLVLHEAYKNNTASNIKFVTSVFGIPDIVDMWNNPAGTPSLTRAGLINYLGTTLTANTALYTQASPTTYTTTQTVPTQLFHGTADTLVRYQQSLALKNKLNTLGVPVQYTEYAGEGHGWAGAKLTDTYSKITSFINQYLP